MKKANRKIGIDIIISNIPMGSHFCLFYKTKQDLIDILVPYFKTGLENNEFCLWITSEPLTVKEAQKIMQKAIPDFDHYLKRGQIEIIPHTQWYLKDGSFNPQRVLNLWIDKFNQALAKEYDGIRITGNTAWLGKKNWRNFTDYEEKVNKLIGQSSAIALCTYALDKCSAVKVIDVIYNHQFALIRREGEWEIIESSEYKTTKEALAQKVKGAICQLKKQHQAQQNFFIDLAHELKTPLTIMKGNLDLASGKNGVKIRRNAKSLDHFLKTQKEEAERIEKIINDLSTLAKAETNQLVLRFQKLRLDELIRKVCLRLEVLVRQEGKKLEYQKLMPLNIRGDQERLEQLVSNLLDNAIKFTRPKTGQIQVSLTQDRGRAKIRIVDNGIGILKKDLPYIFKRFYRGTNVKHRLKSKGNGLGLAICQWIVKEHCGQIKVKSEEAQRTVFSIWLPLSCH